MNVRAMARWVWPVPRTADEGDIGIVRGLWRAFAHCLRLHLEGNGAMTAVRSVSPDGIIDLSMYLATRVFRQPSRSTLTR